MKYLIEGISTFILLLFTFLTFAIGINNFGILGCAITYAFIFGLFYYIFSNKKRVYLNPLLVLIDVQRKKITYKKFWLLLLSEFVASVAAAILVFLILMTNSNAASLIQSASWVCAFGNMSFVKIDYIGAFIFELIISFLFVVMFVCVWTRCKSSKVKPLYLSLIAGLFVLCTYGFTYTGANPAKAFGPALVYIVIGEYVLLVQFVVLCLADFLGAIIAFFVIKKFASKRMTKNIDQITNKHIIENNIQDANSNSANNNQEESNF